MKMQAAEYLLAIDIGTTKICAMIARVNPDESLEVVGIGTHQANGLNRGSICDLGEATQSIESAAQKAIATAGVEINQAWIGIAGTYIQSFNSSGKISVAQGQRGITHNDIKAVRKAAVDQKLPADRQIIHEIPREYQVDECHGVRGPLGMIGNNLGVNLHLVTGRNNEMANISRAVHSAGFRVEGYVFQPIASSLSVLSREEMDAGVALIDIGGDALNIAIYKDRQLRHSRVLMVGGNLLTRDISNYLNCNFEHAEALKIHYGWAMASPADQSEMIPVQRMRARAPFETSRFCINTVIETLLKMIIEHVGKVITSVIPLDELVGGVVLTGGTSLIGGITDLFQDNLNVAASLGIPGGVTGFGDIVKSPTYATAVGMLKYAARERRRKQDGGSRWILGRCLKTVDQICRIFI